MKKKIINAVLAGCLLSVPFNTPMQAAEEYDLVIYAINTETEEFDRWLSAAEQACDIRIGVVPAPTDSDTRQQMISGIMIIVFVSLHILGYSFNPLGGQSTFNFSLYHFIVDTLIISVS